jgi:hypothetical protein
MLSKAHKDIINKIILNIKDNETKILLNDYIVLHNVVMAMYARNVFCYNGKWAKLKPSFNFNYDYVRENNTSYKLTDIEKNIRNYCNKFIENNDNIVIYLDEFIDVIKSALYDILNDIIKPFIILSPKITTIIDKYKNYEYQKKSKKINYEVFELLNIKINK